MAQKTRSSAPRKRRSPEQAQTEILDAAERLIAAKGPDGVGLQQVAKEAGVSHALVTHYFGTYDALVRAVLQRVTQQARSEVLARLADPAWNPKQGPLLDVLFQVLHNPAHVRLLVWSALTGRADAGEMLASIGGLGQVVDGLEAFYERTTGKKPGPELRGEIEFGLMVGICASFGYAVGGEHLLRALGREATPDSEQAFRERLRGLIFGHLVQKALG